MSNAASGFSEKKTTGEKKKKNWNIYNSLTTGQTPSAGEDCVIRLKDPEKLINGPCDHEDRLLMQECTQ